MSKTTGTHILEIPDPRVKSQFIRRISLEFFPWQAEILQSVIHGRKQQRSSHIFGEVELANASTGNSFEPVISSVYFESTNFDYKPK
jgi:hypothetical protein